MANVLVGVGLLLFGLETMGSTAVPLQHAQWLQTFVARTLTSMPIAFVGGFLLAAILQSNTGATLLVITLATGGVFGLQPAAMLIYGTNLQAQSCYGCCCRQECTARRCSWCASRISSVWRARR